MASKIISIIDDPDFWINLIVLEKILYPYYPKLSYINLNKWVQYYYIKWFGKNPTSMIQELLAYKENFFPFNEPFLLELEQTPLDYWLFLSDSVLELSQIAIKLFSICVNSALCEQLFSSIGFLHTKRYNKLNRKIYKKTTRIVIDDESDNEVNENIDNFIKLWFERLDKEDISEDNISDNEIDKNLNELLNIQIHPADNNNTKWDLTTLFKSQLVAPNFFSNMLLL
ncbi:30021_t:CDS:2 [Gigaspora margarita]|uniref:30021_t:CDS:1 n=1 Tax=Gigaspora margarita TaxID=4874 RepID=A0ABN7VXI6_GIGMA|nr:30021_t:CDS:2 [Gigaspora margarita]